MVNLLCAGVSQQPVFDDYKSSVKYVKIFSLTFFLFYFFKGEMWESLGD